MFTLTSAFCIFGFALQALCFSTFLMSLFKFSSFSGLPYSAYTSIHMHCPETHSSSFPAVHMFWAVCACVPCYRMRERLIQLKQAYNCFQIGGVMNVPSCSLSTGLLSTWLHESCLVCLFSLKKWREMTKICLLFCSFPTAPSWSWQMAAFPQL